MKTPGSLITAFVLLVALDATMVKAAEPIRVSIDWTKTIITSRTVPTVFVNPEPPGKPGPDEGLRQIRNLDARNVRYAAFATPFRQVVAAMTPPTSESTSWDFTMMDAVTVPFLKAVKDCEPVYVLPPMPPWMFKGYDPQARERDSVLYGTRNVDLDTLTISDLKAVYTELALESGLVDPTGKQLAEYYARIVSWYTRGGFVDENGQHYQSGYNFNLPWIEVLNEVQWWLTPEQYVPIYDAIVSAIREVSPSTKFIGLGLGPVGLARSEGPARDSNIEFFEYFLNSENHRSGIPLDMVSYHYYAVPALHQTMESWQYTVFDQGEAFLNTVAFMERIRKRLSPSTQVNISELGIILPYDFVALTAFVTDNPQAAEDVSRSQAQLSPAYWNLNAAWFAYIYVELAKQGIDVVTAAELMIGNSRAFPSINLVDPKTGEPNARLPALKLLVDNFGPGDRLVETGINYVSAVASDIAVQAFDTKAGRKLLVINKRMFPALLDLGNVGPMRYMHVVDEATGGGPPRREANPSQRVSIGPFAVGVISLGEDH